MQNNNRPPLPSPSFDPNRPPMPLPPPNMLSFNLNRPPMPVVPGMIRPVMGLQTMIPQKLDPTKINIGTPKRTLYIRNLNERIPLKILRNCLKSLMSHYGKVEEVQLWKNIKMRGQAFVVFDTVDQAQKTIEKLQGFPMFGYAIEIRFAKEDSKSLWSSKEAFQEKQKQQNVEKQAKFQKCLQKAKQNQKPANAVSTKRRPYPEEFLPPHHILFIQHIPENLTQNMIQIAFQMFPGFKEVRMVPGRKDIAFIEYENEMNAVFAKETMNGFRLLPEELIKVTFAKK